LKPIEAGGGARRELKGYTSIGADRGWLFESDYSAVERAHSYLLASSLPKKPQRDGDRLANRQADRIDDAVPALAMLRGLALSIVDNYLKRFIALGVVG
jgi:hypothetical protein